MLENGKRLELTVEEGNELLQLASTFGLPEKLGDHTYTVADRSIAAVDEVGALRRELRSYSPLLQRPERWMRFGPADAWKEINGDEGQVGHKLIDPERTVGIRLDESVRSGISWCLLVAMHPASSMCKTVQRQQDVLWPIARKLGIDRQLRELIGITEKAQPRRWKENQEYQEKESPEKG